MSSSLSDSSWLYGAALLIYSSSFVRFVTVTCLLIGIASSLPLVVFLTIDIVLWCWRMFWHRSPDEPAPPQDAQTEPVATTSTSVSTNDDVLGAQATRRR
ncbi:hypothetical protein LMH87_000591 [Akanthomyces muscarius]|uniref:Uncharacterized protein n=1 Tax=Akanthomyces muscarius TaxID=2231603 RepID=A0A9W8QEU6_AKAMU|nr:hypothetical protein LMH87_000591 [Akanthomyces muscarius]KAJ4155337.1 hypothetical protein LMH87_000591 [Akanthomyces muscarius]